MGAFRVVNMPNYRVVKQLKPTPQTGDAWWAERKVYVAKLDDSEQVWEYSGSSAEASASKKMNELTGSDDSGRKYKVIEVGE